MSVLSAFEGFGDMINTTWSDQHHLERSTPLGAINTTWSNQHHLEQSTPLGAGN
jgi:hypothetical protein